MQGREGESIPRSSFERAKIGILCPVFDPKHVPNNWTQTNSQRLTVPFQQQFPNSYAADGLNGSRLPFHSRFRCIVQMRSIRILLKSYALFSTAKSSVIGLLCR